MHRIDAEFIPFDELPFSSLFRAVGVYVIWDARQIARPSYIGEGDLLRRFATEHASRFHAPIQGYAAILGNSGTRAHKRDAELTELLLLQCAAVTDRYPTVNVAAHRLSLLDRATARLGTIRVALSGRDPFTPPWARAKYFSTGARINARPAEAEHGFDHPWTRRRKARFGAT